jgi:uncharacterized HAD superfamily protein
MVHKQKSKLDIEVFVEDALHNAIPLAESGREVYLLDTPWKIVNSLSK